MDRTKFRKEIHSNKRAYSEDCNAVHQWVLEGCAQFDKDEPIKMFVFVGLV